MDDRPHNSEEDGTGEPEAFTGVYQPRRGPLAKTVAVVILVVLILVPLILALATIHRWDSAPRSAPAPSETTSPSPD